MPDVMSSETEIIFVLDHRLHIYVCICKTLRHYKLADPAPLVTPVVLLLTDTNII